MIGTLILILIIIAYMPLFIVSTERIESLTAEDHFYENLQALILFLAACLMLFLFIRSKSEDKIYFLKTKRNYFFLLLCLFFFLCFGEELSWGQRIFGIRTPEYLQKINAQGEISIHNLWLFESYDKNNNPKTGLMRWITAERLYALSWFFYCVIIPVVNYLSAGMRKFFKKICLPVVPLWIGSLFVLCYIISKIVEKLWLIADKQPVDEIKETTFYFLYLVMCISFVITYYYKKEVEKKS